MNINSLRSRVNFATMSSMSLEKQGGYVSSTFVSLVIAVVFLLGAIGFGGWAFASRQDYKNNSDQKAAKAADASKAATEAAGAIKYAEEAKNPLKTHKGPDQFGGVTVQYPKTWSAYVIEDGRSATPVNDYFYPDVVPGVDTKGNAYSLRIQVVDQAYDRVIESYKNDVDTKKVTATPATLPKVSNVVGTRFTGQIERDKQGSAIILPMRNMTLKIWTESADYLPDFNNSILPNLTFSP